MPSGFSGAPENQSQALSSLLFNSPRELRVDRRRTEFAMLAEQWRRDTMHLSVIAQKVIHPAYLRIIGMGEFAIPLLLEELRDRPSHWFVALKATSGEDPAPTGSNPLQARDAWIEWGRRKGYLH